ncbi:MAG: hypothetical protein ACRD2Z_05200 [Thermoanaerobaculia bacterium]
MPALVRRMAMAAERLREAPKEQWPGAQRQTAPARLRWDVWLAAVTSAGFLALLAADATHPLLVVALEVFLLF